MRKETRRERWFRAVAEKVLDEPQEPENLFDIVLPNGKRLGDARRKDLLEAVEHYGRLEKYHGVMADLFRPCAPVCVPRARCHVEMVTARTTVASS